MRPDGQEDFFGEFGRVDFDDFFDLVLLACASCRVGVGRPFAPDDGVGRFLGGVTRLLVDAGFAGVASFAVGFLALLFFAAPLVSACQNRSMRPAAKRQKSWQVGLKAWDVAAGAALVREAGGACTFADAPADWLRAPGLAVFAGQPGLVDAAIAAWRGASG